MSETLDAVLNEMGAALNDRHYYSDSMGCHRWSPTDLAAVALDYLAERGMVILGPNGEPLDVRPALRALGCEARKHGDDDSAIGDTPLRWLEIVHDITGPLANACLAAAEVEP